MTTSLTTYNRMKEMKELYSKRKGYYDKQNDSLKLKLKPLVLQTPTLAQNQMWVPGLFCLILLCSE